MQKSQSKIVTLKNLIPLRKKWKEEKLKTVFTNGCFDILHLGHVDYLEKARALGDKLIIGINSDKSISDIKGPSRPIVNEHSRTRVIASLGFVDAVVIFEDETPQKLIETLLPDILVKGNDYSIETIVGADVVMENGGEVKTISLVEGFSTSNIIQKIISEK